MCWAIPEKKKTRGVEDILFWKIPVEYFIFLPLEIPGKAKLHSWKFLQNCVRSLENSKAKNQVPWNFHAIFSWPPLEFPVNSWKFHMLLFWYPRKFHIRSPTVFFFFFWNCPLNTKVIHIRCLRCQWHTGELFYYQWPGFHHLIWEGSIFFNKFFWLTNKKFFRFLSYLIQLKQPMITRKVMTENWAYCGFLG